MKTGDEKLPILIELSTVSYEFTLVLFFTFKFDSKMKTSG